MAVSFLLFGALPAGAFFLFAGPDPDAVLWATDATPIRELHTSVRSEPEFSPDGSLIAAERTDRDGGNEVLIWDALDGRLIGAVPGIAPRFNRDGTRLLTYGDYNMHLAEAKTARLIATLPTSGRYTFSPDGSLVVSREFGDVVRLTRSLDGTAVAQFEECDGESFPFSPDGRLLVVSCGGPAILVSTGTGSVIRELDRNAFFEFVGPNHLVQWYHRTLLPESERTEFRFLRDGTGDIVRELPIEELASNHPVDGREIGHAGQTHGNLQLGSEQVDDTLHADLTDRHQAPNVRAAQKDRKNQARRTCVGEDEAPFRGGWDDRLLRRSRLRKPVPT